MSVTRTTSATSTKVRVGVHVVLPLVLGLALYLTWRSKEVHVVAFLARLAPRAVDAAQGAGSARVPALVMGSLPDALWAWAFGATMALVWRGEPWRAKRRWLLAGALVALFAEVGQALRFIPGTYDVVDLVAIGGGYVLGAVVANRA
jgi:hypothetical protein